MVRFVNMRWLLGGSMAIYGFYFILIARQSNATKYKVKKSILIDVAIGNQKGKLAYRGPGIMPPASLPEKIHVSSIRKVVWGQFR